MHLFVKKLVSLNPDMYENLEIEEAIEEYTKYVLSCDKTRYRIKPKTFEYWLESEI